MTGHTVAAIAATVLAFLALAAAWPTGASHACTAPCVVSLHGAAEDGYRADYLHGGTLHVVEVTP